MRKIIPKTLLVQTQCIIFKHNATISVPTVIDIHAVFVFSFKLMSGFNWHIYWFVHAYGVLHFYVEYHHLSLFSQVYFRTWNTANSWCHFSALYIDDRNPESVTKDSNSVNESTCSQLRFSWSHSHSVLKVSRLSLGSSFTEFDFLVTDSGLDSHYIWR